MNLANKRVFITGCNRGMGLAFAERLAVKGCNLNLLVRDPATIDIDHFLGLGARSAIVWQLDLSDRRSIDSFLEEWRSADTAVDVLINNAGFFTAGLIEEQDMDDIYRMLQVNLAGLIHLTHGVLPAMLERGSGKVVNNASISGRNFFPCSSTYAAGKAGVVAFTESIKQELRGTGVSTLLLMTAGVKTDMYDSMEGLFGDKLKLDMVSSVSPEHWANKVVSAIEDDRLTLMPGGFESFILALGRYMPGVLQWAVRRQFNR